MKNPLAADGSSQLRHLDTKIRRAWGIEARPIWKPMHLQPVDAAEWTLRGGVAAGPLMERLGLASGSFLTDEEPYGIREESRVVVAS